jgi:hypothetical protein
MCPPSHHPPLFCMWPSGWSYRMGSPSPQCLLLTLWITLGTRPYLSSNTVCPFPCVNCPGGRGEMEKKGPSHTLPAEHIHDHGSSCRPRPALNSGARVQVDLNTCKTSMNWITEWQGTRWLALVRNEN